MSKYFTKNPELNDILQKEFFENLLDNVYYSIYREHCVDEEKGEIPLKYHEWVKNHGEEEVINLFRIYLNDLRTRIKLSKDEYVKQVRHPMTNKTLKSVKVNGKVYRYNSTYKTYNSVKGNELLYKSDVERRIK